MPLQTIDSASTIVNAKSFVRGKFLNHMIYDEDFDVVVEKEHIRKSYTQDPVFPRVFKRMQDNSFRIFSPWGIYLTRWATAAEVCQWLSMDLLRFPTIPDSFKGCLMETDREVKRILLHCTDVSILPICLMDVSWNFLRIFLSHGKSLCFVVT